MLVHLPAKAEASSSENTVVVRDGGTIGTNINGNKQASPLLLSDVAVFAESLEALFHQVGNHSIVGELVESTRTRLLCIVQRSQWWSTSHPEHSFAHLGTPSTVVHRNVGDAVFYYQLAEQNGTGESRAEDPGPDIKNSLPGALLAALQQLSVQLQAVVRPAACSRQRPRQFTIQNP